MGRLHVVTMHERKRDGDMMLLWTKTGRRYDVTMNENGTSIWCYYERKRGTWTMLLCI